MFNYPYGCVSNLPLKKSVHNISIEEVISNILKIKNPHRVVKKGYLLQNLQNPLIEFIKNLKIAQILITYLQIEIISLHFKVFHGCS